MDSQVHQVICAKRVKNVSHSIRPMNLVATLTGITIGVLVFLSSGNLNSFSLSSHNGF